MYRKFLLTFEKILLLSFSSTATHFDITKRITNHFRKHFAENLISEGTTSHWVEYNDGCAQRYGIHSLLFVIILFSHLIFLLRSNRYMVCSKITISLPHSIPTIPCAHLRGSSFGEVENISFGCGTIKLIEKTQQGIAIWKHWLRSIIWLISIMA